MTATDTYVIATRGPVEVKCPPWCRLTNREHLDDLLNLEGCCFHWSRDREGLGWRVVIQTYTFPDGTPADDLGTWIHVETTNSDGLSPHTARELAAAILAAVEEAGA
jgi:hypothetical protein